MQTEKKPAIRRHPTVRIHLWRNWMCAGLVLVASMTIGMQKVHAADPMHQAVLDWLGQIENDIHGWEKAGSWELSTTITLGIIGLVVAAFQALKSGVARIITAGLGILSGVLVIVNQNCFDADHRAYRSLARQSDQLVRDFKMQLPAMHDPLTLSEFNFLKADFIILENKVHDLERAVLAKNPVPPAHALNGNFSFSLINSAYAIEGSETMPAWAKTLPNDADNFYFVGIANDRSALAARDAAQQQAKAAVDSSLQTALRTYSRIPAEDVAHLAHDISESGELVSTFVVPASGTYRGYALVRVSRSVATLSVKSFFVAHGLSFDPKVLEQIALGDKTKAAAVSEANEQRTAARNGVAYIHVADEKDRGIGEALRKDLSAVISAPGVQVAVSQPSNTVRYFNAEDASWAQTVKDRAQQYLTTEGYPTELNIENLSGTSVKGQSKQIEVWLGAMQKPKPHVDVEVGKGTPTDKLQLLKGRLEQNGYEVQLKNPSDLPSQNTKILYYKDSDATEAQGLVKQLSGLGVSSPDTPIKTKGPSDARPRHFDLRVGKDTLSELETN